MTLRIRDKHQLKQRSRQRSELLFGMTLLLILILLAIIPWSIPLLHGARTWALVMAVLFLGTVFGPAFFAFNGFIQISLDRLLWAAVVGIAIFRVLTGENKLPAVTRTDGIVIGFVAVGLLSCLRFGMFGDGQPPIARWLFYMAIPCSLYAVMRTSTFTKKDIHRIVTAVIALGGYLAFTGVMEMLDVRALVFPRFINDPEVWEFYGRGRGPLLNPAGNGILLTLALAACASRFLESGRHGKAWYAILSLLMLAGCYSTLTRSVWLGAIAAIGWIGMIYVPRRVRIVALAGVVVFSGAMALGLKDQIMSMKRDKALSAADAAKSVELRPLLALVAYEMFLDRPLGGHGYGNYFDAAEPYHAIRRHGVPLENARPYMQHNVFLSTLVDLGLVGFSLQLLLLVVLFCLAWQLASAKHADATGSQMRVTLLDATAEDHRRTIGILMLGMLSGYVCNGMFHEVGIIHMVHMYLFAAAGILVTLHQSSDSSVASPSIRWNPFLRWMPNADVAHAAAHLGRDPSRGQPQL
ncbi:hypothetical protein CEE69_03025 [Rhodopirellula bahusiensis]|uniref:O-antigen ligase-related domain-containing protein n=2 Tax=Rhodopirellula bahusiensis TaxID=2014065 RepID=A0A2G1WC32_9BACT|nr:hypothetical protein CEE69_03025 [Rhodopirellula bahusiensis]